MIRILAVFFILFYAVPSWATAYYVDCSLDDGEDDGAGTYADPWQSLTDLYQAGALSAGDDVYFKVGTTCTLTADSDRVVIDWSGTAASPGVAEDRVIIGAYSAEGVFTLSGGARPILDGDGTGGDDDGYGTYPAQYQSLVSVQNDNYDYITVQDLQFQYSNFSGITAKYSDNVNVDNCYFYRGREDSIVYGDGVDTGIISNNIIENQGWTETWPTTVGAGASITLQANGGSTTNITVTGNKIFAGKHEGIGLYQKADGNIVEYNIVRDLTSHHIYIDASKDNIIRYNLVYNSSATFSQGESGIIIDNESARTYAWTGNNEIYGNMIAGMNRGFSLGCQILDCYITGGTAACVENNNPDACCTGDGTGNCGPSNCKGDFRDAYCYEDTQIYNNTLVDNLNNIRFWAPDANDTLEVRNNISYIVTDGSYHILNDHGDNHSPTGVTWSDNLWYGGNQTLPTTGNASTDAEYGNPNMSKTTGWRSLTADELEGDEFGILTGSDAINNGVAITNYNDRITASDFTASPITVTTQTDSVPDIGAWYYDYEAPAALDRGGIILKGVKIN